MTRVLIAALLLSGCAAPSAYWVRVADPVLLTDIRIVDRPCGRSDLDGCNSRYTGVVQLRRGLTPAQHWCVLNHEKRHLAGFNHPAHSYGFAYDCGNGEML